MIHHFLTASDFRHWLERHHASAAELWVGFYRKASGKGGMAYAEAVDEALCFGWIDGIKKRADDLSFTHRFTPRKPRSVWSRINLGHFERLNLAGRVTAAGLKAYVARDPARSGLYSFENRPRALPSTAARVFQANAKAWTFFQSQPPGYRRTAIWWVLSAKKEETRQGRLARLIADSALGRRLAP